MNPLIICAIVFACVFTGALLGIFLHRRLPEKHLDPDSKEHVRLGMALVGTTVALVLGLLIASAKSFYDSQNTEVTQAAANIVLLDRLLAHYGPEAADARAALRTTVARWIELSWQRSDGPNTRFEPTAAGSEVLLDKVQELSPHNDMQRSLQSQALSVLVQLAQTRWLLFAQKASSVPMPLLVVVVFWLTLLFVSFGLFVRPNVVVMGSLFASAVAVCGAIFLILEMYQPYGGMIMVSVAPLRAALAQLGR